MEKPKKVDVVEERREEEGGGEERRRGDAFRPFVLDECHQRLGEECPELIQTQLLEQLPELMAICPPISTFAQTLASARRTVSAQGLLASLCWSDRRTLLQGAAHAHAHARAQLFSVLSAAASLTADLEPV